MDQYRNASASHLKFACNGLITFNFFFMKLSKKKLELHQKLQKGKTSRWQTKIIHLA